MYIGSKLLSRDLPQHDETNDPRNKPNDTLQARTMEGKNYGGGGRSVWRRKEKAVATSQGSTPLTPVGEELPQQPTTKLIDMT